MSEMQRAASSAATTIVSRIANLALALGTSIVAARALGPSGRGSYFVIVTIATIASTVAHLSVEQAHVFIRGQGESNARLAANGIFIAFASGLSVAAAAFLLVIVLGGDFIPVVSPIYLALALATVPASLATLYTGGLLVLDRRLGRVNLAFFVGSLLQFVLIVVLSVITRVTVAGVIALWIASILTTSVILVASVKPRVRDASAALARRTVALGLRYHGGMVALFLLWRVDVLLLNARVDRAQVGLYSLAVSLAELVYIATDSIAQVALPHQTSAALEDSAAITARAARTNFVLAVGFVICVAVTGPFLIPLLFGTAFSDAMPAVFGLSLGILALASMRPLGAFLIRMNRPGRISMISLVALGINVILNLILIPRFGIVGAALASTAAYSAMAFAYFVWFMRASGSSVSSLVPRTTDFSEPLRALTRRRKGPYTPSKGE